MSVPHLVPDPRSVRAHSTEASRYWQRYGPRHAQKEEKTRKEVILNSTYFMIETENILTKKPTRRVVMPAALVRHHRIAPGTFRLLFRRSTAVVKRSPDRASTYRIPPVRPHSRSCAYGNAPVRRARRRRVRIARELWR